MMMRKIISVLILIGFLGSGALAIDLSSSFLDVGKELSIYGDGFGNNIGKYGGICFNDDSHCFVNGNQGLYLWSDNLIKVVVPSNISLKGKIKVYVNGNIIGTAEYAIKPVIIDISDGNYVKKSGGELDKVLVQGRGFGSVVGNVYFGDYKASIVSWTDNRIWLHLPQVKKITSNFKVQNSAGIFSESFKFNIYPKLSNDEHSSKQEYLNILGMEDIRKNYKKLGDGITVAVMDVGVKLNHPDLKDNLWINKSEIAGNGIDDDKNGYIDDIYGRNFVDDSDDMSIQSDHGTMIAGIISAKKDNSIGVAGIAPKSKIMTLKVFDKSLKTVYNVGDAIKYAVNNGAKIINVSFGSDEIGNYQKDFDKIFEYAYDNNVVVTVAAGNTLNISKQDLDKYPSSPVCNDGNKNFLIGVSSVNNQKIKSDFARYGSKCIDMVAPGENIFGLSDKRFASGNMDYNNGQGTSFATPIVAGAIALLWSNKPYLKNTDIYQALKKTGDDIDGLNPKYKGKLGKFLNIKKLMEWGSISSGNQIQTGIDKKALTMFINIQAQTKNYSQDKQQEAYKSIYAKLDAITKDGKYIKYIEDLKKLVKVEIKE